MGSEGEDEAELLEEDEDVDDGEEFVRGGMLARSLLRRERDEDSAGEVVVHAFSSAYCPGSL